MSITLQPQKGFAVVRQIANHLDSDTNYVRAVIRDAYTDEIIATLDLDDQGSQRFKKNWHVVADKSGQGRYISIVTSVYTDSGYTTKNPNYGDEENTYLVFDRIGALRGGGGYGGPDASDIRRLMQDELEKFEKKLPKQEKVKLPKAKDYDKKLDSVLSIMQDVKDMIKPIPLKEVDLAPVTKKLEAAIKAIEDKEVTPPTDLTDLIDLVKGLNKSNELDIDDVKGLISTLEDNLPGIIEDLVTKAVMKAAPEAIKGATFSLPVNLAPPVAEKPVEEEKEEVDLTRLAG